MKNTCIVFVCALVLAYSGVAFAAPFLVCDPNPIAEGVTHYELKIGTAAPILVPADSTREYGFKYDLGSVPTGQTSMQVKAVKVDPVWGTLTSAAVPFVFTKPGVPGAPVGVRLVQN